MSNPLGLALHDYHFEEMKEPLLYRRGEQTETVDISFYFDEFDATGSWMESVLEGPLLDMGAGAGRHALYFQEQFETVAIEQSDRLVEVLRDRGVDDARQVNMFNLPAPFEPNRFKSAIAFGTQVGLARSLQGVKQFLTNLATVTTRDAVAVIDGFDPDHKQTKEKLSYYKDPSDGLAYRVLQMEYDGVIGDPWLYRLFTPDQFRKTTTGTVWTVTDVTYPTENLYHLTIHKA